MHICHISVEVGIFILDGPIRLHILSTAKDLEDAIDHFDHMIWEVRKEFAIPRIAIAFGWMNGVICKSESQYIYLALTKYGVLSLFGVVFKSFFW